MVLHGTMVCVKTYQALSTTKSVISHEAVMLLKVRHPHICFLIGIQTAKEPYQLITLFYHVNGVSLSVYETRSLPAKLSDT